LLLNESMGPKTQKSAIGLWKRDVTADKIYAAANTEVDLNEVGIVANKANSFEFQGCLGTPLFAAAYNGNLEVVEALLACGAAINKVTVVRNDTPPGVWRGFAGVNNEQGWTPLMAAVKYGFMDVVKVLIGCGANLDLHNAVSSLRRCNCENRI
jgi:hypothetical protein